MLAIGQHVLRGIKLRGLSVLAVLDGSAQFLLARLWLVSYLREESTQDVTRAKRGHHP